MDKKRYKKEDKSWIWLCSLLVIFFIFIIVCYGKISLRAKGAYQDTVSSIADSIKLTSYNPPTLKSLIVHPESTDNYFDFILDTADYPVIADSSATWSLRAAESESLPKGEGGKLSSEALANEEARLPIQKPGGQAISEASLEPLAKELIDYFFLGITLPSEDLWVNLNSVRQNAITSPRLALTDIGKVLLEADLTLKKDCCRFTDPRTKTGKEYWRKLQSRLNEAGLSTNQLPIGNRFWIIPEEATVEEDKENNIVTIVNSKLKVCLQQEYLELQNNQVSLLSDQDQNPQAKLAQDIADFTMKETVLPRIQEEVNYAQSYAKLRQVYNSLILAEYYKQRYHNGEGLYPKLINRAHIQGLESTQPWNTQDFYDAYVKSAQEGEYKLSQQEYDPYLASMVQKYYFYGGILIKHIAQRLDIRTKEGVISDDESTPWYVQNYTIDTQRPWKIHRRISSGNQPKLIDPKIITLAKIDELQGNVGGISFKNDMDPDGRYGSPEPMSFAEARRLAEIRELVFTGTDGRFHLFGGGVPASIPYMEEAQAMTTEVEIPKGKRQATLRLNKEIVDELSAQDLKKVINVLTKNYRAEYDVRSKFITLDRPITHIKGAKLEFPIEILQLKGVVFDSSRKIDAYKNWKGHPGEAFISNEEGYVKFKDFEGMPQGGNYLSEAINEFIKTDEIRNNAELSKKIVVKYPIGWGKFFPQHPFYDSNTKKRRLGYVILGGSKEMMERKRIFAPKRIGSALRALHDSGYASHYTHYGNLGFLDNDIRIVFNDLGALIGPRDKISKEQLLALQLWGFYYTLRMQAQAVPPRTLSFGTSVIRGYFPEYKTFQRVQNIDQVALSDIFYKPPAIPVHVMDFPFIGALKERMERARLADWGLGYFDQEKIERAAVARPAPEFTEAKIGAKLDFTEEAVALRAPVDLNEIIEERIEDRLELEHFPFVAFEYAESLENNENLRAWVYDAAEVSARQEDNFEQIVRIVLANALHFKDQEVDIIIKTFVTEDGKPAVSISDTGSGITLEKVEERVRDEMGTQSAELKRKLSDRSYLLSRIFERGLSTKEEGWFMLAGRPESYGRGRGLSVVKDIMRQSQGRILVETEPEIGTKFTFIFEPLKREAKTNSSSTSSVKPEAEPKDRSRKKMDPTGVSGIDFRSIVPETK